jgi:hypothetical protein
MTKHRIAYIDESDSDIRRFQRFSFNHFEVVALIPKPDINETCNDILTANIEAIVSDFEFAEQLSTIHYDGTDLVSLFLKKREGFPVFILTSFEDDAISKGEDVNIIYEKKEMETGQKFLEKIKNQIEKYKAKLKKNEDRLLWLIQQSKSRKLDSFEIEELIKLDSLIEKSLDNESQIPNILRDDKEAKDLTELLKKVDDLTKKLDKGK